MSIDCALCFRDENGSFFINAYVTLLSVFANTGESVTAHILHDETITADGRRHLSELCAAHGQAIRFHRVPDFDPETAAALSTRFNLGATYRYFIHEFVKAPRAVYLDCDVIVNRDLNDLYALPLGESLLAGVTDHSPFWKNGRPRKKYADKVRRLGLKAGSYINSGVLLMNLDGLRALSGPENVFMRHTLEAIGDGIRLEYPDMDIMNSVAARAPQGVLLLDESFNLWHQALHLGLDELQGTIFHFISKPDREFFPAHLLFWKYYAMSPFAGDMFERMSAAYTAKNMRVVRDYILNPKERRHAEDLLRHGLVGMLGRAVGRRLGLCGK